MVATSLPILAGRWGGGTATLAASDARYRRVVVKLSGRAFAGDADFGLDNQAFGYVAHQLMAARELGIQEAVVVGGGNFFRGNVAANGRSSAPRPTTSECSARS